MAGITKAQAEARLTDYLNAEEKVLSGQSYNIGGRTLTRADLKAIREGIEYWERKVKKLNKTGGGLPVRGVTPVD